MSVHGCSRGGARRSVPDPPAPGPTAVAGLLAGAAAQLIVLGRITLGQVEEASWPRVVARIDPVLLSGTALVVAVLLGTVALLSAWATVRRARGASLREKAR